MSNINNYLVGKFVVAPRSIGLDAEKIRQLTLATHVELIVEPDGNIDETNTANRYNYWSMNMACEIVSNSYHVSHDIFQVYGAPNSDELLLISDSIRCIEFDANTAWDFHRNVYIVWQTGESIGQFNECWPDTPPSPIKLNPLTIPMFVSDAYKEAYSKLYSANTRLWEEGYGNISSAFETAW